MVDWNKDVKLSDLLGRKKSADDSIAQPTEASVPEEVQRTAVAPTPASTPAAPVAGSPAPPAPPAPAQVTPTAGELAETLTSSPDEPDAATDVPWYKRELSFGKKSKTDKPKREKAPKEPKQPKQKAPKEKQPKGEKVPLHKRELSLSLRRGSKSPKSPKGKARQTSQSAKRMKRVIGLKLGGSQLSAARVHNNGVPELV